MGQRAATLAAALFCVATASYISHADTPKTLDGLITSYLDGRGAEVQIAPSEQLARRFALDFIGVVPTPADVQAMQGKTPADMFDYFASKGAVPHTDGETPYVWINLLKDADFFLLSNSTQFSQVAHIVEFRDQLRRTYAESWSYKDFARWALESQMFLNRFPSGADRANAAFFLFLGRDSLASEVPVGNMWNGYALTDANISNANAETDPLFHVHDYDFNRCSDGSVVCSATLWSTTGSTPAQAIDLIVETPMFAEATVNRFWERFMGYSLPGVEFPDMRKVLVEGLVASNFDINWLVRELTTSPAYTQEMMFR
jgi:hypothetical protein